MNDHSSRALRVLWVTNDLPPQHGGIESFIQALLTRTFLGTTHVLGPRASVENAAYDHAQPYTVRRLAGRVLPTPSTARTVIAEAATYDADVIILGAMWPLGHIAGRITRATNIPVIALSHGHEAGLVTVGGGWLIRHATANLAALTTIAEFTERRLYAANRAQRTIRIPPGVDPVRFSTPANYRPACLAALPDDAKIVGALSRMVPRKGFDRLLDGWRSIVAAHPDAWLVLAGDGPDRKRLQARAAKHGAPQVIWAGVPASSDLPALYQSFDVFVQPVRTRNLGLDVEGLGIVFLEAQAAGIPLVVGRSGGAPETVRSAQYGTVIDGRDPAAIASAVIRWLDDDAARKAAREPAQAAAHAYWSWDRIAEQFTDAVTAVATRVPRETA